MLDMGGFPQRIFDKVITTDDYPEGYEGTVEDIDFKDEGNHLFPAHWHKQIESVVPTFQNGMCTLQNSQTYYIPFGQNGTPTAAFPRAIIAKLRYWRHNDAGNNNFGLGFYDTGQNRGLGMQYGFINGAWKIEPWRLTNFGWASSGAGFTSPFGAIQVPFFFKVQDNGTTITSHISLDGIFYRQWASDARGVHMTTTPGGTQFLINNLGGQVNIEFIRILMPE